MFVMVAYDVEARRTSKYRKILVKYLGHEQFSVFFGDITRSTLEKMRRELNKLITDGDRVLELIAENRNNLDIIAWSKDGHTEGIPKRQQEAAINRIPASYSSGSIGKLAELAGHRTRAAWRSLQFRDSRLLFTYTRLAAAVGFPFPMRGWKSGSRRPTATPSSRSP